VSINSKKVGALIRHLRKEHKLTQRELAKILEVEKQTIYNWEKGEGLERHLPFVKLFSTIGFNLDNLLLLTIYSRNNILNFEILDSDILEDCSCSQVTIEEIRRLMNSDERVGKLNQDGVTE
jgi:DNA-binding XRE family transcriptional regulator